MLLYLFISASILEYLKDYDKTIKYYYFTAYDLKDQLVQKKKNNRRITVVIYDQVSWKL